ncbi:MAG: SpoIIE family protein phosphatase [Eubacterium sp.]|nr:SpoIIE family protein phosphatase [Eubacterium sp.]
MDKGSVFERFLAISIELTAERDRDVLLSRILDCAMDAANCDAGTFYLLRDDGLHFCRMVTRSQGVRQGGHDAPIELPPVPMDPKYVCAWVAIHKSSINVPDVRDNTSFDFTGSVKYDEMTGYRTMSMLVIPMTNDRGELIGVTQLINAMNEQGETVPFDPGIEKLVSAISSQAAISIANTYYVDDLTRITAEKERIRTELSIAASVQKHMMPTGFPVFTDRDEFEIYAIMEPAKEVGGDFYDFFLIDDHHLAMVVADVSGKGIPAALFMMTAKTMIKTQARLQPDPVQVMRSVNDELCENNEDNMFVTAWLGILDTDTGLLTYSDAGHERLFVYQEGVWRAMPKQPGLALAIFSNEELEAMPRKRAFCDSTLQLSSGDVIFQYTDGVTEATDAEYRLFGEERLLEALNSAPSTKPEELLAYVHGVIDDFVGDAPQFDDMTMLCLQLN